jgi:hypothetical protein
MLNLEQAQQLKQHIVDEAPQLEVKVAPDIEMGMYHLELTLQYPMVIRSLDSWNERKKLLE